MNLKGLIEKGIVKKKGEGKYKINLEKAFYKPTFKERVKGRYKKGFLKRVTNVGRARRVKVGGKFATRYTGIPTYGKKREKFVRKGIARGIRQASGMPIPSYYQEGLSRMGGKRSSTATRRRPGRPRGTYKYAIEGKPVDVFTWRRYMSRRRAMERLQMQQAMQSQAQQYQMMQPTQAELQDRALLQSQQVSYQPPVEMQRQVEPPQATQLFSSRPVGGTILDADRQGNILKAPNIMRGELRNTQPRQPVQGPDNVVKPVSNVQGDYYTDVDPLTGKPILRRRIRERWLS